MRVQLDKISLTEGPVSRSRKDSSGFPGLVPAQSLPTSGVRTLLNPSSMGVFACSVLYINKIIYMSVYGNGDWSLS